MRPRTCDSTRYTDKWNLLHLERIVIKGEKHAEPALKLPRILPKFHFKCALMCDKHQLPKKIMHAKKCWNFIDWSISYLTGIS